MPFGNRSLRAIACLVILLGPAGSAQAAPPALVSNSFTYLPLKGAPGMVAQGQLALIAQTYADQSSKKYLLTDVNVQVPNSAIGIGNVLDAPQAPLTASFSRSGAVVPYAECVLEPRAVTTRSVSFSVGLKSAGDAALIRWGICKDPSVPGYNSIFPDVRAGDSVMLRAKNGQTIGQYNVPAASVPSTANSARQSAVLNLLSGRSFKVSP